MEKIEERRPAKEILKEVLQGVRELGRQFVGTHEDASDISEASETIKEAFREAEKRIGRLEKALSSTSEKPSKMSNIHIDMPSTKQKNKTGKGKQEMSSQEKAKDGKEIER